MDLLKTETCSVIISQEKRHNFGRDTKEVVTGRRLEKDCEFGWFEILSPLSIRLRGKYAIQHAVIFIFYRRVNYCPGRIFCGDLLK